MDTTTTALTRVAALLLCLILVACSGGEEPAAGGAGPRAGSPAAAPSQPKQPSTAPKPVDLPEAGPITEDEMKNYLGAVAALQALGQSMRPSSESAEALSRLAASVQGEGDMGEALKSHGFDDLEDFQRVHVSVATAYAAAAWGDVDDEFGKQELAELEELRPHLSAEKYERAKKALEETRALHDQYAGVNGPNRQLVEKYRAQLDAIFG